ncbi:hypothetical protein PVAP13_5KG357800 [Panicum virgatum]|uniref:Uncharacterized protein n=1 Tax=Panicum virgatum TaxID=38727 RepID=A0A8T0SPX2_PANVG|nr:hypothetical protein PVAP13_5KG357800 [Panicum virgatum]
MPITTRRAVATSILAATYHEASNLWGFNLNRPCRASSVQVLNARSLGPSSCKTSDGYCKLHSS